MTSRLYHRTLLGLLIAPLILEILCEFQPHLLNTTPESTQEVNPDYSNTAFVPKVDRRKRRYLSYDVNPVEGFNLRIDVYIRVANLIARLRRKHNWILVLPPWGHLYHWNTSAQEGKTPWGTFFDEASLSNYIPVIELNEVVKASDIYYFDEVMILQADWKSALWGERILQAPCLEEPGFYRDQRGLYRGLMSCRHVISPRYQCFSVQGTATVLQEYLTTTTSRSVFVDRFEEVLHILYGQKDYWEARRSLVFAKHLRTEGDKFRREVLNSTDDADSTVMDDDWRENKKKEGVAKGGPYIGVHLRRGDFLYAHPDKVPSLDSVVKQINKLLKQHQLEQVFLATDADQKDIDYLKAKLPLVTYNPPESTLNKYGDGGVAIIDQWISAHAKFFIGTCESTFSFRIYEERDILGFHGHQTFNCLCGDKEIGKCEQPTKWRIVY